MAPGCRLRPRCLALTIAGEKIIAGVSAGSRLHFGQQVFHANSNITLLAIESALKRV
jgi:hypothetical protein